MELPSPSETRESALARLYREKDLLATLVHDIGHLGLNNGFLTATSHELALTLASTAAEHQHQGQGEIGGGICQHAGRVADGDAMRCGTDKIDMVYADTVIGNHPAAPRSASGHHIGVDHI